MKKVEKNKNSAVNIYINFDKLEMSQKCKIHFGEE